MFASVPPRINFCADSGTLQASNRALYCRTTPSIPSTLVSEPNTSLTNALGLFSGDFESHSCPDHQKIFLKSPRRSRIFVSVVPLRSKNTLGFQRVTSAAHSYSGLP